MRRWTIQEAAAALRRGDCPTKFDRSIIVLAGRGSAGAGWGYAAGDGQHQQSPGACGLFFIGRKMIG